MAAGLTRWQRGAARRAGVVLLATVAGVALTARLGWWQLDRAAQKNTLQAAMDSRRAMPPLPVEALARDETTAAAQHHRRVVLQGRWQPQSTVYLENRQMQGRPGFFVVTPLLLSDGTAVLVQRGWQPRNLQDRTAVVVPPTPLQTVDITGRIAPPPARLYDFAGAASGPIRQNLDVAEFSRETRLALRPVSVLQEDPGAPDAVAPPVAGQRTAPEGAGPDGLLRQWPAPAANVHKHYGYAFQWFALSALMLGLYVWFQLIRPRLRGTPHV